MEKLLNNYFVNVTKESERSKGVYKIYHINDIEKIYVGSSDGKLGFKDRWRRHYNDLLNQKHCNKKLLHYFNKYNLEGIKFEILEICDSSVMMQTEQKYIDLLNPYFNICKFAGNTKGVKPTYEQILKISKVIDQYSLDGVYIQTFINSVEASKMLGSDISIRNCAKLVKQGKKAQSHGFQWKFAEDNIKIGIYENPLSYKILVYNKEGVYLKNYNSIFEAGNDMKIPHGNISKNINFPKNGSCYGYCFKKYSDNYPLKIEVKDNHKNQIKVIFTDLQTNEIQQFNSFRKIPSSIMSRGAFSAQYKKNGKEFILHNKYKVQIIPYN